MSKEIPLATAAAALALVIAVGHPDRAGAQAPDLVAQGRQALDADKVDEALALFENAVTADPKDPAALAWLGSAQVRKARTAAPFDAPGWAKKSFNTLDEAVERFPDAFVVYMVRGTTATRVPDMFRKAPVAVKDLSAVDLHLGLAYKKAGQPADARAAWEKGKTLYPSAPEAQAIEQELKSL